MNLKKGKKIFFKYNGNHFHIEREVGDEYKKCNIPFETEKEWRKEIKDNLLRIIQSKKGIDKIAAITSYIDLLSIDDAVFFLNKVVQEDNLDTFSAIIVLEILKRYVPKIQNLAVKYNVERFLKNAKNELLKEKITIDKSFVKLSYMKEHDFSNESILNRINKI